MTDLQIWQKIAVLNVAIAQKSYKLQFMRNGGLNNGGLNNYDAPHHEFEA
jgi:hypothetical protein